MRFTSKSKPNNRPSGPFCGGYVWGVVYMYLQLDTCHAGELYAFCYGKQQMMNDNAVRGQYNVSGYCITPN